MAATKWQPLNGSWRMMRKSAMTNSQKRSETEPQKCENKRKSAKTVENKRKQAKQFLLVVFWSFASGPFRFFITTADQGGSSPHVAQAQGRNLRPTASSEVHCPGTDKHVGLVSGPLSRFHATLSLRCPHLDLRVRRHDIEWKAGRNPKSEKWPKK